MQRLTKLGIAQLLISRLFPKPTNDKKLTEPQAMLLVAQARDELAKRYIYQNRLDDKTIHTEWLSTFKNLTPYVNEYKEVVVDLPARTIALFHDLAIYHVFKGYDESELIMPTRVGESWIAKNDTWLHNQPSYKLEQDKLVLQNVEPKGCTITVRMLATAEDIDPTAYFPFDGSMLGELLDLATQRYLTTKQLPEDLLNNNVSE